MDDEDLGSSDLLESIVSLGFEAVQEGDLFDCGLRAVLDEDDEEAVVQQEEVEEEHIIEEHIAVEHIIEDDNNNNIAPDLSNYAPPETGAVAQVRIIIVDCSALS